jgi:hypothetical protein
MICTTNHHSVTPVSDNVQRVPTRRHRQSEGPPAEPRTAAKVHGRAPCTPERAQRAEAALALLYAVGLATRKVLPYAEVTSLTHVANLAGVRG